MKAITIWQPWASSIALGYKKNETRSWPTNYRGPIAIHAAKRPYLKIQETLPDEVKRELSKIFDFNMELLHTGAVIAIAELKDCRLIDKEYVETLSTTELLLGDYTIGRYAWELENIRSIYPIKTSGKQGLWNIPDEIMAEAVEN